MEGFPFSVWILPVSLAGISATSLLVGGFLGSYWKQRQLGPVLQKSQQTETTLRQELATLNAEKVRSETLLSEMQAQETRFQEISEKTLRKLRDELEQRQQQDYQIKQSQLDERLTNLLTPLKSLVEKSQKEVDEVKLQHLKANTSMAEQIRHLIEQTSQLNAERRLLADALSNSKGRGDWGEMQLIRLLEESGLLPDIHYQAQATVEGGLRPDIAVRLPNERVLYIDVKTIMVNLERLEAALGSDVEATERKKHAAALEKEILSLSIKAYESKVKSSVDFVVLFVPRESMLRVALEERPDLLETAFRKRVILASPLILMPILRVVAQGWQQAQLSENAQSIQKLGLELHKRAVILLERFLKMGDRLEGLQDQYDETYKAFSGRQGLVPHLHKLETLGCKSEKKLPLMEQLESLEALDKPTPQSGEFVVSGRSTANFGL